MTTIATAQNSPIHISSLGAGVQSSTITAKIAEARQQLRGANWRLGQMKSAELSDSNPL